MEWKIWSLLCFDQSLYISTKPTFLISAKYTFKTPKQLMDKKAHNPLISIEKEEKAALIIVYLQQVNSSWLLISKALPKY